MNETEQYEAKEYAKGYLGSALEVYFQAATELGFDESYQAGELEDLLVEVGKRWDVVIIGRP